MKRIKILLIALILVVGGVFFSNTYAATRELGAQLTRPFTNSKYQYLVPSNSIDVKYTVVKIFDNADKLNNQLAYTKALYCLRGGLGFGATIEADGTDISETPINYTEIGEMHDNAESIINKYEEFYGINLDRTETINNKEVNIYNAILWILDEAYLPADRANEAGEKIYEEAKYKEELLTKIGIPKISQSDITKDDLEAIQQLAIWYFANYDEQKAGTKPTVSQATMFPAQFLIINENNNFGDTRREENLNKIYQYFIHNAIENCSIYQGTETRTKYVGKNEFDKSIEFEIESIDDDDSTSGKTNPYSHYYKIGPFAIKNNIGEAAGRQTIDLTNIILYDANGNTVKRVYEIPQEDEDTGEITSGGFMKFYIFIDSNGNEVTELEKGTNYYIKFYKTFEKGSDYELVPEEEKYDMSQVSLELSSSYSLARATFLVKENTDQPVVEIEKEKKFESDKLIVEEPKEFDLSLRKYISAINGNEPETSRIPQINTNTLINGINNREGEKEYTATYSHPKTPLNVQTEDKVTYTIRVYNEGELDGTATQVTDYLPEGLELVPASESTINTKYGWTVSSNDPKIITTDYLKDTTIKAFDKSKTEEENGWQKATTGEGGLYYGELQIECKVIAVVSAEDQKLRNIAAITEDTEDDRDSEPGDPGRNDYNPPADNSSYKEDDDDYEDLVLPKKEFDLSLRKYIVKLNGEELEESRVPQIDASKLNTVDTTTGKKITTADYKHRKDPISVEKGDEVTYRFSVYNEGDIDGYVYSIIDYLPEGLEFDPQLNPDYIEYKENYETSELEGKKYIYKIEENKITITAVNSNYLFEKLDAFKVGNALDSDYIDIQLKVTADVSNKDKVLTNVATMTYGSVTGNIEDRDSKADEITVPEAEELLEDLPGYKGNESNKNDLADSGYHYKGQQDDDDFEKIVIEGKEFDLSLRKYISAVNGKELEEGRVPQIDTSKLNTVDTATGKKITTADYKHSKDPLTVKKGDLVTYKIRIYNEGQKDGYATKVTDYLPDGLGFLYMTTGEINSDWMLPEDDVVASPLYGENGIYSSENDVLKKDSYKKAFGDEIDLSNIQVIQVDKKEDSDKMLPVTAGRDKSENKEQIKATDLIKAYGSNVETEDLWQKSTNSDKDGLFYQELEITCIVLKENTYKGILKNVAEITAAEDSEGNKIENLGDDRDSEPNNVYEDEKHIPGEEIDGYTPGEQDDDDFEPLQLKYFDLALRKFITSVETNGKVENVTSRIPVVKIGEDGNIVYEHDKEPLYVASNDIVTYTIRVFNEGTIAGYAEEITDDIPEGLEYLPENNTNKQYEWKMYDKDGNVTEKIEDAVKITTNYLSESKEKENNLIKPFDSSIELSANEPYNPDYRDIKVAFKVKEPNTSDRIIINSAQISEDSDDDIDSEPGKWNEGEDDQDKEYIYVKYFDLSLLKWVTKTVVTVDGKTTTTETGFKPNTGKTETTGIRDNKEAEPIAKVEVDKKKLNKTIVKFVYKIKVTNEGEIEGYSTEITDFIPEGLEFKEEDNKAFGWTKKGDNKVTTRALETVLLKPGESKEVEIVFTWKNDEKNLGQKMNVAEITEDYNEHNSKDIDSTPDNKKDPYEKEQEDDDDFALVILTIKTGKEASYTLFITAMISLLAGGIYLVKKYVLTY